ncbi:hypothetical protein SAMN05444370_11432 [Rubrimonas cliftonensis]|uniref:Uncharacterized protein n=1 Tax=Rubrimonas cliftonensis TaxID=89524 RepID=A0A1H4EJS0_9RHOB|nr:hypothetical protein SAMN05444370_11432 [Rubrimonas cliftonensis]
MTIHFLLAAIVVLGLLVMLRGGLRALRRRAARRGERA